MASFLKELLFFLGIVILNTEGYLEFLTEAQKTKLGELSFESLPERLQLLIKEDPRSARSLKVINAATHWCCKINPTRTIVNYHSQIHYVSQGHKVSSSHHCGTFGWRRCSSDHMEYKRIAQYSSVATSRQVPTTCPDKYQTCCHNYVKVADHCVDIKKIQNATDDLIVLGNNGILG